MRRPLSWSMRFALALSAVFVIGTLCAGGLSYLFLSQEMTQRLSADVRASAESLAHIANSGGRTDLVEQINAQARANRDGASLFAYVDSATGETLGSLHLSAPFAGARRLLVGKDIPENDSAGTEVADAYSAFGIKTDIGWVIAARDDAWVAGSGEILIKTTAWSLALSALLSFGLALVIARRNERRIARMDRVLDAVGVGQMNRRIRDEGDDDLAELADRVDRMLERLEAGVESIRQVSTDVAHDLRAPLSRLRMRLEPLALSATAPQATRHEIGSALVDIDAIATTFDAILRLARLRSGSAPRRGAPVDLNALAVSVHDILAPSAEDRGHSLRVELPPTPAIADGDEDLLTQALTNLVGNAIEHCTSPAQIAICVTINDEGLALSVADTGPGIPLIDRARVLERFVRLDASRSVAGTGLGLSLVAAIAQSHNARLRLDDNRPGLRVSLIFPSHIDKLTKQ